MEDLAPLAEYSGGRDIDDNGHVVGYVRTGKVRGWSVVHAFLYTDKDGLIDLGTLGGYNSSAAGINSGGEVVGVSADATTKDPTTQPLHGFLYTNKTDTGEFVMVKLEDPDLIINLPGDFQGWIRPRSINDSGQICGKIEGSNQAVLLTPGPPRQ
jgi:probable HAF family extracellular repeat protein